MASTPVRSPQKRTYKNNILDTSLSKQFLHLKQQGRYCQLLVYRILFINFVNFIILPVYVAANIYPTITDGLDLSSSLGNSIITARLLGKVIGITLFALLGAKLFKQSLALKKSELIAGSAFAGMGLAVSIMIANLSYPSEALLNQAKAGLLIAAVISGVVGSLVLVITSRSNSK